MDPNNIYQNRQDEFSHRTQWGGIRDIRAKAADEANSLSSRNDNSRQYGLVGGTDPMNMSSRSNVKLNSLNRSEINVNQKRARNILENQADDMKSSNKLSASQDTGI